MTSIGERIKELRKALELSQESFGKAIYLKRISITQIERGTRNPSERTLKSICKEFKVSYSWLCDGIGEVFEKVPDALIDKLVDQYNLDINERNFIEGFVNLLEKDRKVLAKYLIKLIKEK